jgi:hypothetical protein
MKRFRVALHRDYLVEIDAENKSEAEELTEYFLSTPIDDSTHREQEKHGFRIHEIDLVTNDAFEAEEISNDANNS